MCTLNTQPHAPTPHLESWQWEGADVLGLLWQTEDPQERAAEGSRAEEEGGGRPCSCNQGVFENLKEVTISHSLYLVHAFNVWVESKHTLAQNVYFLVQHPCTPHISCIKCKYIILNNSATLVWMWQLQHRIHSYNSHAMFINLFWSVLLWSLGDLLLTLWLHL